MPDIDLLGPAAAQRCCCPGMKPWAISSHRNGPLAAGGNHWPTAVESAVSLPPSRRSDLTGASFSISPAEIISAFLPTVRVRVADRALGRPRQGIHLGTDKPAPTWAGAASSATRRPAVGPRRSVPQIESPCPTCNAKSISLTDAAQHRLVDQPAEPLPSLPASTSACQHRRAGQQTGQPDGRAQQLKAKLKKPGNALHLEILGEPAHGRHQHAHRQKPADLVLFHPQVLEVKVGFRVSCPITALRGHRRDQAVASLTDRLRYLRHQQSSSTATTSWTSLTASASATASSMASTCPKCASTPSWWPSPNSTPSSSAAASKGRHQADQHPH